MLKFAERETPQCEVNVHQFALAGLARLAASCATLDENVRTRLQAASGNFESGHVPLLRAFREYLQKPGTIDDGLLAVARQFRLTLIETLAVRLAMAAEDDVLIGHVLTHLQQPLAKSRPTVGLLAQAFAEEQPSAAVHVLGQGAAVRCGLLQLSDDDVPLPEREVRVQLPSSLAIQRMQSSWPGTALILSEEFPIPLGPTAEASAVLFGERLFAGTTPPCVLVIRSGDPLEARAAAEKVCSSFETQAVLVNIDHAAGIAPWLFLNRFVPVFTRWLAPGERISAPAIPAFAGPTIVLTGPDGDFEPESRPLLEWRLTIPPSEERIELWSAAIGEGNLPRRLATEHRYSAGRIAALGAKIHDVLTPDEEITYEQVRSMARRGESSGLGALAELIADEVGDEALVVTCGLRQELESLVVRCRLREQVAGSLGPSIQARYRPSVRALFAGPSGTGKTLAAAWLATRLGMPLYRVDLSAITSKYIGETEKNLSQLFTRAEQNEVVLLFDEADSLFGKRTDIHEANDRFANAQTNYLLQRMESYDGITVLTSNGRGRFDAAFSRRFDAIVEFPSPGPEQRHALWRAHLGTLHGIGSEQLDLVASVAELSGGQIRNAVLKSAVAAAQDGKTISYRHLLAGLTGEYTKLSRQLPNELKQADISVPV